MAELAALLDRLDSRLLLALELLLFLLLDQLDDELRLLELTLELLLLDESANGGRYPRDDRAESMTVNVALSAVPHAPGSRGSGSVNLI